MVKVKLLKKAFAIAQDRRNWRFCSPDTPPCALCKRLITSGGIFLRSGMKQIAFHTECGNPDLASEIKQSPPSIENSCLDCGNVNDCPHINKAIKELAIHRAANKIHATIQTDLNAETEGDSKDWLDSF